MAEDAEEIRKRKQIQREVYHKNREMKEDDKGMKP